VPRTRATDHERCPSRAANGTYRTTAISVLEHEQAGRATPRALIRNEAFARTPILLEATSIGAFRPTELSKAAACYVRFTSIPDVAAN
jgi:hypothetical protein